MPSFTTQDLSVYKDQQIYVYNSSGTFLDCWRDAPVLDGFKEAANSATTPIKVVLPRSFDSFDQASAPGSRGTVAQGNIVKYYLYGPFLPAGGLLRFQGIIDTYEPTIAEDGAESVTVTIVPQSSVIADHGATGTVNFGTAGSPGTYVDPVTIFNYFFSHSDPLYGQGYLAPLTLDGSNPSSSGTTTQYTFDRQTMQDILNIITLMLPANWFYRCNPDLSVTLNVSPTTAQHVLYIGQNIANPSYAQDWINLKNVIVVKGATVGSPPTLVSATRQGGDVATVGARVKFVDDSRITDSNSAAALAQGYLNRYDQAELRVKVRVPDFRGDWSGGLGYDIESFKVGDTVQILDPLSTTSTSGTIALWDQGQWDVSYWDGPPGAALNQVVQIISIDYHFYYVDLELGALQPNQDRALREVQAQIQDFTLS